MVSTGNGRRGGGWASTYAVRTPKCGEPCVTYVTPAVRDFCRPGLVRLAWLALALTSVVPSAVAAQERFNSNRFQPAPTIEDGFATQLPDTLGHLRFSVQLLLDYANDPVVVASRATGERAGEVVGDSLFFHMYAALGLWDFLEIWAGLPVAAYMNGDGTGGGGLADASPSSVGLGQPQLGVSARVLGRKQEGFQLGLNAALGLPVGTTDAYAADDGVTARGWVNAAYYASVVPVASVGVAYRPSSDFENVEVGSELFYNVGLHIPLLQRSLRLIGEVYGTTNLRGGNLFSRTETPLELLGGAKYTLPFGLQVGGAAAMGLTRAVGSPGYRILLTVGYAPPRPADAAPAEVADAPPAPPPPADRDGDGIPDIVDACPDEPEDFDGFEDEDGCPDPDNDQDGFLDADDQCPNEPETYNNFQDDDGCPDEAPEIIIESGEVVMPEPIKFAFDSDVILPQSYAALRRVVQVLDEHPEISVLSIEGHTSDEGSPPYNKALSERRAGAVVEWLVKNGAARSRLRSDGFGVSRPLVPNNSEENRKINRRVEFIIRGQSDADLGGVVQ